MVEVKIVSGICGFETEVQVENESKYQCTVQLRSTCPHVTRMAEKINRVDAMAELFKKGQSQILTASQNLPHVTCPAAVGILKAVEAAAGLALPKDASITFLKKD